MTQAKSNSAAITIFGAQGDLTKRKLIPALYNLYIENHLPKEFIIYCVDFIGMEEDVFRNEMLAGINEFSRNGKAAPAEWEAFAKNVDYIQGDFLKAETYTTLKEKLKAFDAQNGQAGT
ncbi:MAG: glucose-6-phosphate dehydrogenase, partial [Flavitalea sp.]